MTSPRVRLVVALASLASFAPAVPPIVSHASAQSAPIDIGSLSPFGSSFLWAVNNRSQAVGWSELGGLDTEHAILWRDGELIDLGLLPGDDVSRALGINDRGQIVGYSVDLEFFRSRAVLWQDGQVIDITPAGAGNCGAAAINKRGEIAGVCDVGAVVWHVDGITTLAPPPGYALSRATGINDKGAVAGAVTDAGGRLRAFRWSNGTLAVLPLPSGADTSFATAIDDRGDVVGYVARSGVADSVEAVIWRADGVAPLAGTWGAFHGIAWGVNDRGAVVGSGHDGAHLPGAPGGAFVWAQGRFRFLPDGANAQDINDHGIAVGRFFVDPSGILHGIVWPKDLTRISPHGGPRP
jgi:probable HAF family extracellular repeat protein